MYSIEFSNRATSELERIYEFDRKLFTRLLEAIQSLTSEPFQGKKLKRQFEGDYSLCVGTYRILYTVYRHKLVVSVIDVGHRRDIYRK